MDDADAFRRWICPADPSGPLAATAQIPKRSKRILPEVQLALLRIVQEALSNVHRHASASRVTVRIKIRRTMVLFGIFDNGKGIRSAVAGVGATGGATPGLGVPGMHARMRHLDGALMIRGGTRPARRSSAGSRWCGACGQVAPSRSMTRTCIISKPYDCTA